MLYVRAQRVWWYPTLYHVCLGSTFACVHNDLTSPEAELGYAAWLYARDATQTTASHFHCQPGKATTFT
jgi:hypothetical protein